MEFHRGNLLSTEKTGLQQFARSLQVLSPTMRHKSQGEMIHILKLALARKILAFKGKNLGPYDESRGFVQQKAEALPAQSLNVDRSQYVSGMMEFKQILFYLLRSPHSPY